MKRILRFLEFLGLVDGHDNNVSLTKVALWVVIAKLALVGNPTVVDLGGLLLALVAHNAKKVITNKKLKAEADVAKAEALAEAKAATRINEVLEQVEPLKKKVQELSTLAGFR